MIMIDGDVFITDDCDIIDRMSFSKQQKKLNQQVVFNPPPGYYQPDVKGSTKQATSFGRSERFVKKQIDTLPGPGAYNDNHKERVRQRLIEQSQKREVRGGQSNQSGNIKISSIPSIPKKSATRVYEELAPGILILHEEEYQNTSIGPGSYNVSDKLVHPKPVGHKIAPEHKPKPISQEQPEINVPTIAEEIRNQRRMMYKQNLYKASTVNKSQISPSDLCLEVIILREKLLRSDDNPPPGYYHNQNLSSFKSADPQQRPPQAQCLGGKEKRWQEQTNVAQEVGPGSYKVEDDVRYQGGFIPRQPRKIHQLGENKPGPGAYISEKPKGKVQNKASYPPIFGSGCTRFVSAPKQTTLSMPGPGPGSYQIEKKKNKKQKYIKIKREFLEPSRGGDSNISEPMLGIQNDMSQLSNIDSVKQRRFYASEKHSSNFASKVQRFIGNGNIGQGAAIGLYDIQKPNFSSKSFNKQPNGYIGNRVCRFDQTQIRPKIGPGTYNPAYQTVKQKKIINVVL